MTSCGEVLAKEINLKPEKSLKEGIGVKTKME